MTIKLKTRARDAAENLDTEEGMAAYLGAALEDGDPELIGAALGDIARAKGNRADCARHPVGPRKPLFHRCQS
jgi:probable addiction module antidote protein